MSIPQEILDAAGHFPDFICECGHNGIFHATMEMPLPEKPGWVTHSRERYKCTFCNCKGFRDYLGRSVPENAPALATKI